MTIAMNILAVTIPNPIWHIVDEPWVIGGRRIEWFSAHISVMVLAALILGISMPLLARRHTRRAREHSMGLIEMIILFVRSQIARPTLGPAADKATPFLATLFMFLLLCNLLGMVPLLDLSEAAGLKDWGNGNSTPIGGTPTSGLWVCLAFAAMSLLSVFVISYIKQVLTLWRGVATPGGSHPPGHDEHATPVAPGANVWLEMAQRIKARRWPLPLALPLAVWTWLNDFVPPIPGIVGFVMWPVLLFIELIGYVARCFALCVRLLANMNSGHILLAVLLIFAQMGRGWSILLVSLPAGFGLLLLDVLELLVAVLQAYIFTFLSALFIGLAASPQH